MCMLRCVEFLSEMIGATNKDQIIENDNQVVDQLQHFFGGL